MKILLIILLLTFTACASRPALEQYPRREIDRPYTIPKGVATWHIPALYSYEKNFDSGKTSGAILPFIWEVALSDSWNLTFTPIPLGISHQFVKDDYNRFGFSIITGFSYRSSTGLRVKPGLFFGYRHTFSDSFALDVTPSFVPELGSHDDESAPWTAGFTVAPLFQLSDHFALAPEVSVSWFHQTVFGIWTDSDITSVDSTETLLGSGLSFTWSLDRQWDLRGSYRYVGLNSKDVQSRTGVIEFVHFW